jgi:hypothetical protein
MKGRVAIRLFKHVLEIRRKCWGRRLWSRGYFVCTIGVDEAIIQQYVQKRRDVRFRPSVEAGFGDDRTLVQMLAEVHYVFSTFQALKPYAGAGLGLTYVTYDDDYPGDGSDTGGSLNAIGGVETELKQGMNLFFELKVGLTHDDPDIKFGVRLSW